MARNASPRRSGSIPEIGAQILRQCGGFAATVIRIVREHRERPDGSGFPHALAGEQIHPLALLLGAVREFQVQCRVTDAEPTAALAWLFRELRPVYGEEIIDHLISSTTVYPPGTYVQLSDGSMGRVLRINEADRMRPVVGVIDEEGGRELQILDLSQEAELAHREPACPHRGCRAAWSRKDGAPGPGWVWRRPSAFRWCRSAPDPDWRRAGRLRTLAATRG